MATPPNYLYYSGSQWGKGAGPAANIDYWIRNRRPGNVPPELEPEPLPEGLQATQPIMVMRARRG